MRFTNWGTCENFIGIAAVQTAYYSGPVAASSGFVFVASTSFTGYFISGDTVQVNVYSCVANTTAVNPWQDSVVTVMLVS